MFIYQRVYIKLSKIDQGDITMSGGNSTYSTGAVIDPATFDWKKKLLLDMIQSKGSKKDRERCHET